MSSFESDDWRIKRPFEHVLIGIEKMVIVLDSPEILEELVSVNTNKTKLV